MERSRKLTLTNWTKANDALNLHFEGNKSKLTKHLNMSRTTVTAFFKEEPIREAEFRRICLALRLNWQEDSSVGTLLKPQEEDLLEQIRSHCREKILNNYSKIRLLSGQEIGVDQLYVDVWLLNRQPRSFQVSESKMLESFDLRNDRLGLGDRIRRNPGFDIANQESRLLILGKPGAGKTTFLKHLAIDWCRGKFQANLISVFIEFRQIRDEKWQLLNAIGEELKIQDREQVELLLQDGKLLILMDGFDEVPTQKLRQEVQKQLGEVAKNYSRSRYIITCRTQIIQGIPDGFASVEVADFKDDQVETFVRNWFQVNSQDDVFVANQWNIFSESTTRNLALKELTTTPVILGLICLVLQDEGDIPTQINLLYERGIKLLLQKWNDEKAIDDWEVGAEAYRQLDVERKEELLIQIAVSKFEDRENFVLFEENELVRQIVLNLNLSKKSDGRAIIRSIESQHGLLIERADALWSFSHLTFQEYFAIKWLLALSPEALVQKITDENWSVIVQQLISSGIQSDRLLLCIKQAIDQMLSGEHCLQNLLTWLNNKTKSVQENCQDAAVRAFYLCFDLELKFELDIELDLELDLELDFELDLELDLALELGLSLEIGLDLELDRSLAITYRLARALMIELDRSFNLELEEVDVVLYRTTAIIRAIYHTIMCAMDGAKHLNPCLMGHLTQIAEKVYRLNSNNREGFQTWYKENGHIWSEELRQVMIKYRDIGHEWKLNEAQSQELKRYYDINRWLVELLEDESVTPSVRQEIEDNLILPIAELKNHLPKQYGPIH
jgi:predicted NACHT family NTPase